MSQNMERPQIAVIIIGAGIAGLMLAILLEQIDMPYHIFERASEVRQLGSAMAFDGCSFPALEQLGLYEEIKKISKPYNGIPFYDANLKKLGVFKTNDLITSTGYPTEVFARPRFYELLLRRVPKQKISFKKKILRTEEEEGKVTIHCSDNTSYTGDIIVGADGAYSAVRQNMHKQMEEEGVLPKSDMEDFSINYITIVGVATPDPEKYPQLKDEYSNFSQIIYGDNANCYVITLPDNQISWGLSIQLPKGVAKDLNFRNSEWGPETNDATLSKYRDFPCPLGGTMGDLFDATPKELISKVFLEEKLFKKWHHSRSVLIGDACHKLHPAGGLGGRNAMDDAIALANCLYFMKDSSEKSIVSAFESYYKQRYRYAEITYTNSAASSKILYGQRPSERLIRRMVLKYIPDWLMRWQVYKTTTYRQQVAWLPLVKNRGKASMLPQQFESAISSEAVVV
ncbi:hypothetical protein BGZ46_001120 [Entomortierella lignicola]|nr:hypothetical protein BGZ46_001120 [Entomortierella lignicola]